MTPGSLIRQTRRRKGLSQAELALRAGTKQSTISRLERDEISPSIESLELLLRAMGQRLVLATASPVATYDPLHRRANAARSPAERLRLAMSWNRLAGRLARAGRRARARPG
ncbi:MAG: multiprotein-bridging factor 1 family protein [Acidimicrobiia bacterium]